MDIGIKSEKKQLHIAIDMTPYIPGGANGGVVNALFSTITCLLNRDIDITVLTTSQNYGALEFLEKKGVKRFDVSKPFIETEKETPAVSVSMVPDTTCNNNKQKVSVSGILIKIIKKLFWIIRKLIKMLLPHFVVVLILKHWFLFQHGADKVRQAAASLKRAETGQIEPRPEVQEVTTQTKKSIRPEVKALTLFLDNYVDVLYCPFSAIPDNDSDIPCVSVVNDIQHKYMPYNFSPEEISVRDKFYSRLVSKNPYILAISDYTRKSFIETYSYPSDRIETLYLVSQDRFKDYSEHDLKKAIDKLKLKPGSYIYYPANNWPHKNHRSLLVAFRMFKERNPELDIKLILTGAVSNSIHEISIGDSIKMLGLDKCVSHLGYVSDLEVGALLKYCRFLVFPSYFEGLGLPLVEAMAMGSTIIASNVTSLPEVGGKGAFYCNPYDPKSICSSMEYVIAHPSEAEEKKKNYDALMKRFFEENYIDTLISVLERVRKEKA